MVHIFSTNGDYFGSTSDIQRAYDIVAKLNSVTLEAGFFYTPLKEIDNQEVERMYNDLKKDYDQYWEDQRDIMEEEERNRINEDEDWESIPPMIVPEEEEFDEYPDADTRAKQKEDEQYYADHFNG